MGWDGIRNRWDVLGWISMDVCMDGACWVSEKRETEDRTMNGIFTRLTVVQCAYARPKFPGGNRFASMALFSPFGLPKQPKRRTLTLKGYGVTTRPLSVMRTKRGTLQFSQPLKTLPQIARPNIAVLLHACGVVR